MARSLGWLPVFLLEHKRLLLGLLFQDRQLFVLPTALSVSLAIVAEPHLTLTQSNSIFVYWQNNNLQLCHATMREKIVWTLQETQRLTVVLLLTRLFCQRTWDHPSNYGILPYLMRRMLFNNKIIDELSLHLNALFNAIKTYCGREILHFQTSRLEVIISFCSFLPSHATNAHITWTPHRLIWITDFKGKDVVAAESVWRQETSQVITSQWLGR